MSDDKIAELTARLAEVTRLREQASREVHRLNAELDAAVARLGEGVVEWGVRFSGLTVSYGADEATARIDAGASLPVTRTRHTSPWVEVSEP